MYTESQLVGIAKRENNNKRKYLVVNKLQGKHIPVSPKEAFGMFDALADKVKEAYKNENLLLVGFAETATAIGARLAVQLGSYYMQTTREQIPDVEYLFFSEAHSHATEQKLIKDDVTAVIDSVNRIVFVEDEVTTGNTILNIINILEKEYPGKVQYAVASLLNGMDEAALKSYQQRNIDLHYLVKTDHAGYTKIAESYAGDGNYREKTSSTCHFEEIRVTEDYQNARRCICGSEYEKSCEALAKRVGEAALGQKEETVLVLGTEEFMYPAMCVGAYLEAKGKQVKCHATTRSPIATSSEKDYPLHTRYELASLYEEERRTFIYDLETYDRVIIVTDADNSQNAGVYSLVNALESCKNKEIQLVRTI